MGGSPELLTEAQLARELKLPETAVRSYCDRFLPYLPSIGEDPSRRYWPAALPILRFVDRALRAGAQPADVEVALAEYFSVPTEAPASEVRPGSPSTEQSVGPHQLQAALRWYMEQHRATTAGAIGQDLLLRGEIASLRQEVAESAARFARHPSARWSESLLPLVAAAALVALVWYVTAQQLSPLPAAPESGASQGRSEAPSGWSADDSGPDGNPESAAPANSSNENPVPPPPSPGLATPLGQFRVILDEDFVDNRREWPDDPQGTAWLDRGTYHLFARRPGQFVAVGAPISVLPGDVAVEGDFRKVGGPPGGEYGLIVRDQGPGPRDGINQLGRFYAFTVADRGELHVSRRDGDRWNELLPWTRSQAVSPGDTANQLAVYAIGERFTFVVNGTSVATVSSSILMNGGVGLFVAGDQNEVEVDRLVVSVP